MEVKFINAENGVKLGARTYEGITHTIIPAFSANDHDIYLKKSFEKNTIFQSWQIKNVLVNAAGVEIYLQGTLTPDSVFTFADKQRKNFKQFIRKHNLVEVDFGHETSLFSLGSGEQKNTRKTDALMPGEMHKKRPCIVMGTKGDSVTVIPLTTRDYGNPKHVLISKASFANLHARYSEKSSFAALDMVQTVSAHRVFPPREAEGKYRHQYSKYKLSDLDGKAVDNALADIYNDDVTKQLKIVLSSLDSVNKEKSRLLEKYREVATKLDECIADNNEMEDVIRHLAKEFSLTGDLPDLLKSLKAV